MKKFLRKRTASRRFQEFFYQIIFISVNKHGSFTKHSQILKVTFQCDSSVPGITEDFAKFIKSCLSGVQSYSLILLIASGNIFATRFSIIFIFSATWSTETSSSSPQIWKRSKIILKSLGLIQSHLSNSANECARVP